MATPFTTRLIKNLDYYIKISIIIQVEEDSSLQQKNFIFF